MKVFCLTDGCQNFVEINETLEKGATFMCRDCTPKGPDDVRFQDHQLDKDLRRAALPEGTDHLSHQGSDVLTSDRIYSPHIMELFLEDTIE